MVMMTMNFGPRRKRPQNVRFFILAFVSLVVFLSNSTLQICAQETRTCAPPSSSNTYDWEDENYYEILGLSKSPPSTASRKKRRKERAAISSSDIRKAYRKQAQLYHPDKQKVSKNQTITVEERNARFARIAEAYEVLMDSDKRQEYDQFLLDCEDHLTGLQQQGQDYKSSSSWSSIFDNLSTDPRRVFEEFFFGSSASDSAWEDVRYTNANNRQESSNSYKSTTPIRVYETREVHRDPYTGQEILRILQTEEFQIDTDGKLFIRVTGQDFVEQYDRYRGWTYVPISRPFLVEEGYTQGRQHRATASTNTLSPGEYMFPESSLLTSSSGSYHAGLSKDCELLIMTERWDEEHVVWSSGTFVPPAHLYSHGGCFLALRGPHLVLILGTPNQPGNILWYSDVPDNIVEEEERILAMGGPPSLYVARLDDDGSLAVYRHETSPPRDSWDNEEESPWWQDFFLGRKPQTRAARAWNRLQDWVRVRILHRQRRSTTFPKETCIFATSPAGCNFAGRTFFHIAHGVGHTMKHTMTKIDNAIETIVEGMDEDEDLFDTVLRVANQASNGLFRAGRSFVRIQVRRMQKFYQRVMKRFQSSRKR